MIPLHPKLVHFPVALLISAAAFGILALLIKSKREVLKEVLFWNLILGVPAALIAVITGLQEESVLAHNDTIHSIMEVHKFLGFIIAGVFVALLIWMLLRRSVLKNIEFTVLVAILVLTAALLGYSAHLGGKMVYEHGAGIAPMKSYIEQQPHQHDAGNEHEHHQQNNNSEEIQHDHGTNDHGTHNH